MIHFCTCTGQSASTIDQTKKQEVTSSCKICGHKPFVYDRGALSGSMLSTAGLDFTGVIDPGLNWKTVSSNKRATRRARASLIASNKAKQVAGTLNASEDLIDKDPKKVEDMPVSESEKLGVSILGRRFSDTVENVPIKKRKFPLVRSPSPPPGIPPQPDESECLLKYQSISCRKKPALYSDAEQQATTVIPAACMALDQAESAIMVVDGKYNMTETKEKHGDSADFSGISILAAAACSSNIDCSASNLEEPKVGGLLVAGEGSSRILQNTRSSSMPEELSEKHLLNHSILDGKTDLNICIETHTEKNPSVGTSKDHHKDLESSNGQAVSIISEKSIDIMQDLPAKGNETMPRVDTSSSWDDRSHWDLNIVMDAWGFPCDDPIMEATPNATFGIGEDGMQKEKVMNFEHCPVQMELGEAKGHIETSVQHNVGGTVTINRQGSCRIVGSTIQKTSLFPSDSSVADIVANKNEITCISVPGILESNEEKHDLDACTVLDRITCSQEKIPCEIVKAPNRTTDVSEETKPLDSQEQICFNADLTASAPVECELGPASHNTCAVAEEKAAVQCTSFDSETKGEIVSSNLVVSRDNSDYHTSHFHEPHGADYITENAGAEGKRGTVSVVDPDKQLRDQYMPDAEGSRASCSRSPSPGGDRMIIHAVSEDSRLLSAVDALGNQSGDQCMADVQRSEVSRSRSPSPGDYRMTINMVSEDSKFSSSVVALGNESGDQCIDDTQRGEASCSRSPQVEKHVARSSTYSDKDSFQINDSLTFGHCAEQTSGMLIDGNISKMTTVDGHLIEQSKTGGGSSCHLDSSVQESLNCEEIPAAGAVSQGDKQFADMNEQDGKTSVAVDEDVNDTEMNTHLHIDSKDSVRNSERETPGVDIPAVMGGLVSVKAYQSNEDNHAYGSGEVALDFSFNSDYDSDDVSQNENAIALERVSLFQADDDSQYEDGEFRESVMHSWEEDEGEEGEAEHVDYGSDNIDTDAFETAADYDVPVMLQVDSGECKKETPSDVAHVCQGGKLDGEKDEKEPNCQPSLQGSLEADVSPIKSGERKAVKAVRKVSRGHLGKKDSNGKLEMDVNVVSELSAGGDKVLGDEEFGSRELHRSTILRTKSTGWDQLPDVCRSSRESIMDVRDSDIVKNRIVSRLDLSHAEESLSRVYRSTSRRELSSRIEGSKCTSTSFRKDEVYGDGSRSNNFDDVNPRMKKDAGVGTSSGRGGSSVHMHGRGRVGDHWLESSGWGRNHHNSPGYHGSGDHVLPGSKNAATAAAAKLESNGFVVAPDGTIVRAGGGAPDGRVHRHSANSPSQNAHRSLTGRGSPAERDGGLGFAMPGHGHMRDMSPSRSISGGRGRSRYGHRVFGTGQRERYNGPAYNDDIDSSLPIQHPLARRQRSFSPIPRRAFHRSRSCTKSQSRSRTRSPHMWTSPRGRSSCGINRGPGLRQQLSRSPNFRAEARMERMRSPPRRLGFPEHIAGFVPAPRNHDSPPHASRFIDDRRGDAPAYFREHDYKRSTISERSPPGRGFSRNHRFDLMNSPERMKPDEHFRPMHSGRFSEFVRVVRGRFRHEGSDDDRRKHGERYRMVNSTRHYDNEGDVKRFRYDVEDGFGAPQSRVKNTSEFRGRGSPRRGYGRGRGIENRLGSAPKSDREERGHIRYDRDGKHNGNLKTFGIRECDDDDAAVRRRRPF